MASDYKAIREENERRYGTDVRIYGDMLLRDRYDDRTHFIFELLQNAEDAYGRRTDDPPEASVRFICESNQLTIHHYGADFTEADVRGICGIGRSTKDLNEIGKFGIGFKSVYAFTESPEIRSGEESFAIRDYVFPYACEPRGSDGTAIVLPFRGDDHAARDEIVGVLKGLGSSALLFLGHIEEIRWEADNKSGHFVREEESLDELASIVTVIGHTSEDPEDTDEQWLRFRRPVHDVDQELYVEVAFALDRSDTSLDWQVRHRSQSKLTVFFPTVVDTHCGMAIQGPYETTPSRDNVKRSNTWNQALVDQTATVIIEALRWLRDEGKLTAAALQCLPIRSDAYEQEGSQLFAPLYQAVLEALRHETLLPTDKGGFVPTEAAVIGTRELRSLFTEDQLSVALSTKSAWLTKDITPDRTPDLHNYLTKAAEVRTMAPEVLIRQLSRDFLEVQDDDWVRVLYEYLGGLNWRTRLDNRPLVRLADGSHVPARADDGRPSAYLPPEEVSSTDYPLVRRQVVATEAARNFLEDKLKLVEPDPVEDVIRHVLPKYDGMVSRNVDYDQDVLRIGRAARSDSKSRRGDLLKALKRANIVRAINLGSGEINFVRPSETYLPTPRLRALFDGVTGVWLLDDSSEVLGGDEFQGIMREAGALDHLRPVEERNNLSRKEMAKLREKPGLPNSSGKNDRVVDWKLVGLERLLDMLPSLPADSQSERSRLLWEALQDLEHHRQDIFIATYKWTYYGNYSTEFPSLFLRQLKEAAWVFSATRKLRRPSSVIFESLNWPENSFLQSKIKFKSPVVDELASEAGIEPEMLDLLIERGVRTQEDLLLILPGELRPQQPKSELVTFDVQTESMPRSVAARVASNDKQRRTTESTETREPRDLRSSRVSDGYPTLSPEHPSPPNSSRDREGRQDGRDEGRNTPRTEFHSFVGVWRDDIDIDPDSNSYEDRMALEDAAIKLILAEESDLVRMPPGNVGYDLKEQDRLGNLLRVVEVKALRVAFVERPVTISRAQFNAAQEWGGRFWLYVVEQAGKPDARIFRIHDPVAQASHFTFDNGWEQVAVERASPPSPPMPG